MIQFPALPKYIALIVLAFAGAMALSPHRSLAEAAGEYRLDTAFTYQGRLERAGVAAEGVFDLSFELFDAKQGGASLGREDRFDVAVHLGQFAAELDFGDVVRSSESVWMEIQVRREGEGDYTAVAPRNRLAGDSLGLCTVNSDVLVNGSLKLDPPAAVTGLEVDCCSEAGLDGGGQIGLVGFLSDLRIDSNEIQARSLLQGGPFYLNPDGGAVGVGVSSASAPLHLPAGPDAELGSGGALVVGTVAGANLAIDGNEIMARNGGAPATLFVNNDGGTTSFGGAIDIGYTVVVGELFSQLSVTADCPAGTKILGGGCWTADNISSPDALVVSAPYVTGDGWTCIYDSDDIDARRAYAICARVQ